MGIFSEWRTNRQLRQEIEVLIENFKNSQHRVAELEELVAMYKEDKATKQRIIETCGENARKLRIRCKKQQNIIDAYKEKYGDLDPKKEPLKAKQTATCEQPLPTQRDDEKLHDSDPYIFE